MRFPIYIASRWTTSTPQKHTKRIIRLGTACIAFCMAMIIIAICILVGFKQGITQKVYGFGSHLQIFPYISNNTPGLSLNDPAIARLDSCKYIKHWEPTLVKEGLLKGADESAGILFKGLSISFDTAFFADKMICGRLPRFGNELSNDVLISKKTADMLQLGVGDKARTYFITDNLLRSRAFSVVGIYETGLESFDEIYMLGDLRQIQRLLNWDSTWIGSIDISLFKPEQRQEAGEFITTIIPYEWSCYSSDRLFAEVFDWLALIDINVWVLLCILWTVAIISLLSILFICILERRPQAAILSVIGASNKSILSIFSFQSLFILGKGIVIGNLAGLAVCILQYTTHLFKLNQAVYFLSYIPIAFPIDLLIAVNLLCICVAIVLLLLISWAIGNRFEPGKDLK